ncbi:hypothetical protein CU007_0104 [Enterococcus faecium]|nr:hypothetical protein EfmE1039_1369 [Enterococcus faecium E1039]MBK4776284.1 hypothetical protein [Enterococcus faecium]MBK4838780.1 hypothetical protein [Enterococcus faecium]MBK4850663.1 hypothetical protein [Enterococcus faecium]MBK4854908.1 hypothetical protein [Enterococcus faecium]
MLTKNKRSSKNNFNKKNRYERIFLSYRFHCCVLGIFAYLKKTADI